MEKLIKWFDLERFGAALRVIPESPLRGIATTCLEIKDRKLYEGSYGFSDEMLQEDKQALATQWARDKKVLGFSDTPEAFRDEAGQIQQLRFHSLKTQYSMTELRSLFPRLEAGDLREMSVEDVALSMRPDTVLTGQWQAFAEKVLAKDAVRVWTPIENPYDTPFYDAPKITEADPSRERNPFPLLEDNSVSRYYGLPDKLHRANYRANALIPYYASLAAAIGDGWESNQLKLVDMPYVMPLWVTGGGKIIGVRDIRFAPEIMDIPPESYFKASDSGLIVSAIRDAEKLTAEVSIEMQQWEAWSADGTSLGGPDHFWASINRVVTAVEELRGRHPRLNSDSRLLADGDEASRGGTVRAKALPEFRGGDMRLLALMASRFVEMDDAARTALSSKLIGLLEHAQEVLSEQAMGHARESLRSVADRVRDSSEGADETKVKHVDAGEKIGGARKDFAKRSLVIEDLESMNDLERKALVSKKNIWPALNYVAMRENGVTPQAAVCLKYLKDKLSTEPLRAGRTEYLSGQNDFDADYIRAIEMVRDAVADVRSVEDLVRALRPVYEGGASLRDGTQSRFITGGTPTQIQWGRDAAMAIYECSDGQLSSRMYREVRKKVDRYGRDATSDQQWSSLIKPKKEKSEAQLEAAREKAEQDRELHRPHLEKVQREGPDWRSGRDITADDLIEHFGFRAVEFGNWLPQDERQTVLNMAFDSFCDLADGLDIAPKGLSLDGDLAIAFGSRGSGGKSAALAHFEPARMVINLTRMRGAGSLAHEWAHALDFYLGEKKGYSSLLNERSQVGVMAELVQAMKLRPATSAEAQSMGRANAKKGQEYALSWVPTERSEERDAVKAALGVLYEKAHALFYESAELRLRDAPGAVGNSAVDPGVVELVHDQMMDTLRAAATRRGAFTKVQDKVFNCVIFSLKNLGRAVTAEVAIATGLELPEAFLSGANRLPTDYVKEAAKLDKTRSEAYWETTHEMFARAGAAFVHDRLQAAGVRSDYLVYGADEDRHKDNGVGNPNPTGSDRKVINEHFLKLMNEYRNECLKAVESSVDMEI